MQMDGRLEGMVEWLEGRENGRKEKMIHPLVDLRCSQLLRRAHVVQMVEKFDEVLMTVRRRLARLEEGEGGRFGGWEGWMEEGWEGLRIERGLRARRAANACDAIACC